ncbi:hypothetical protein TWF506_008044 [Arthrobotrys conoides]|uniref:Uncharacterized protein n=1 Tax=Arthrobotrys conoides TaxID=74498 RepID=A0AAN8NIJ1_9PEZI
MADVPAETSLAGFARERYGDDDSDSDLDMFTDALSFQDDPESTFLEYALAESTLPESTLLEPKSSKPSLPKPTIQTPDEVAIDLEGLQLDTQHTQPAATTSANPVHTEDEESLPQEYVFHPEPGEGSSSSSPQSSSYGSGSAIDNLIKKHKKALTMDNDSTNQLKIEDLIPVAPPVGPKVIEIMSVLDSFDIYNFMWQFITDLSLTDPERRSEFVTSPALSDTTIITILSEILESITLEDVLDGWIYIWEFVVAPRLTEEEAEEFVNIKNNYFAMSAKATEERRKNVQHTTDEDEEGLMYFDDPDFQWPLKPTAAYLKLKNEGKKRAKAEKTAEKLQKKEDNIARFKEIHAMLDASLPQPLSSRPKWGDFNDTSKEVCKLDGEKVDDSAPIPGPSGEITTASHPHRRQTTEQQEPTTAVSNPEQDPQTGAEADIHDQKRQKLKELDSNRMDIDTEHKTELTGKVLSKSPDQEKVKDSSPPIPANDTDDIFSTPFENDDIPPERGYNEEAMSRVAKRAFGFDGTKCLGLSQEKNSNPYDLITLSEAVRRIAREVDHKEHCFGGYKAKNTEYQAFLELQPFNQPIDRKSNSPQLQINEEESQILTIYFQDSHNLNPSPTPPYTHNYKKKMGASLSLLTLNHPEQCVQTMEDSLTHLTTQILAARHRKLYPHIPRPLTTFNRYTKQEEDNTLTEEELKRGVQETIRLWKVFEEGVLYLFLVEGGEGKMREWVREVVRALEEEVGEIFGRGVQEGVVVEEGKGKGVDEEVLRRREGRE